MAGGKTMRWGWWALCLLLQSARATTSRGHAEGGGFCFWTRTLADGRTHQTFLRWQRGGQLALYHGLWGHDGHLQECVFSRDVAVTRGYLTECQERPERRRRRQQLYSQRPQRRFSTHTLLQPGLCVEVDMGFVSQDTDADTDTHMPVRHTRDLQTQNALPEGSGSRRTKRGVMMIPGTLWCGSGNTAADYSDLGAFAQTDQCCREHDHCKYTITSFRSGYGVFNTNIFTLSHCDCDNRFKQCLQQAEDSMAGVVGYGYFNLLKMRCFEWSHRMECTQRTWWGRCLSSDLMPYAVVQEPTDFNSTLSDNSSLPYLTQTTEPGIEHAGPRPGQTTTLNPDQPFSATRSPQPITSTTNIPNTRTSVPDTRGNIMDNRANITDSRSENLDALPRTKFSSSDKSYPNLSLSLSLYLNKLSPSHPTVSLSLPDATLTLYHTEFSVFSPLHMCSIYKFLDDCRLQVPPLQELFGLKNTGLQTLYHCNCTKRLAEHLPGLEATKLHALVLDFVSDSCFTLPHIQSTSTAHSRAVLLQIPFINGKQGRNKKAKGRRRRVDRVHKPSHGKRAKRKDWGARMYRKCLRIHSRLQTPKRH
ncbi:hypothetical protein ACEWY4_004337 [Coilia grayii]|uniref:phospholipase A2 n=1 Tax=Coilia grayii TaxID=363190 RepID=A0ABD1KLD1_9TELE